MRGKIIMGLILLAAVVTGVWAVSGIFISPREVESPAEPAVAAPIKLASLHPLLSEMARRIGGDAVEVVDLFPPAAELHSFTPSASAVAAAAGSRLLLACGKGVEPYLQDLRDSLPPGVTLLELGNDLPNAVAPDNHTPDPHWWNTPANMKRASAVLATALAAAVPDAAADIAARQQAWAAEMDELTRRARLELTRIPLPRRVLVTEHAAMCHFCVEFHFMPIAVQGVAKESEGDTAGMARLMTELRDRGIPCLFAEEGGSPRFLQNLSAQLGAELRSLYMDGTHPTGEPMSYEEMFLHNVRAIRDGLQPKP